MGRQTGDQVGPSLTGTKGLSVKGETPVKLKTILAVLLLLAPAPGFGKKIKPEEFTVQAKIVEVLLHDEAQDMTAAYPSLPPSYSNPEEGLQKGSYQASAAAGERTTAKHVIYYNLITEIGDKVYDLRGTFLLQLGTYPAKFKESSRGASAGVVFLSKDKKGKSIAPQYLIVGVRMKTPEKIE